MSKLLIIFSVFIFISFTAITIFAKSENSNSSSSNSSQGISRSENSGNANGNTNSNREKNGVGKGNAPVSSSSPNSSPTCAPETQWKNHGDYVSCVARLHIGGEKVSEAARSDIGKKQGSASASLTPSPSSSSSASPSLTPNPSASESASISAILTNSELAQQLSAVRELIRDFFKNLKHLFNF